MREFTTDRYFRPVYIRQACGNTMPDLPDQVLDSTGQVLCSACPLTSEISFLGHSHNLSYFKHQLFVISKDSTGVTFEDPYHILDSFQILQF